MLQLNTDPIGRGKERTCYVHPDDPRIAIKVSMGASTEQSRREIRFYRLLQKRRRVYEPHIPKFYGLCDTNLGKGIVVDLIRNYDGEISRPLNWYLAQGCRIEEFENNLIELKQSFLKNLIIFNHDLTIGNLLFQKASMSHGRLVAIDGLGDVVAIDWFNRIPMLARRKIERRWERFIDQVYRTPEVDRQRDGADDTSLTAHP